MKVLSMLDGSTEVIQGAEGIADLVYERLGYDAYCVIHELIQKGDVANHQADSDFRAYELGLESAHRALQDVNEINDKALDYLNTAKRLDRQYLGELLRENQITILNEI